MFGNPEREKAKSEAFEIIKEQIYKLQDDGVYCTRISFSAEQYFEETDSFISSMTVIYRDGNLGFEQESET